MDLPWAAGFLGVGVANAALVPLAGPGASPSFVALAAWLPGGPYAARMALQSYGRNTNDDI
jgi:hypothetical protein